MPPAFNLSQDQTLKFNTAWPNSNSLLTLCKALDFLARRSPKTTAFSLNQAPTPIGCHLFKEHLACNSLFAFRCERRHSTCLFRFVKQFEKLIFSNHPTTRNRRRPALTLDLPPQDPDRKLSQPRALQPTKFVRSREARLCGNTAEPSTPSAGKTS